MPPTDEDLIPALEVNECGDELPGCVLPFPQLCAYPDCEKIPIVGVNKRFVCEDHMKWVLKPMRDIVRLVEKMT
jgi:hypothetical protein